VNSERQSDPATYVQNHSSTTIFKVHFRVRRPVSESCFSATNVMSSFSQNEEQVVQSLVDCFVKRLRQRGRPLPKLDLFRQFRHVLCSIFFACQRFLSFVLHLKLSPLFSAVKDAMLVKMTQLNLYVNDFSSLHAQY